MTHDAEGKTCKRATWRAFPRIAWRCLLGLTLTLASVEVALRGLDVAEHAALYYTPELGHRFLPNQQAPMTGGSGTHLGTMTINAAGFRGPVFSDAEARALRVACLGDSFTFGWGVKDHQTFPVHLQAILAAGRTDEVEVVNFGMPGYNTGDALRTWIQTVRPTRPDIVVFAFYLNDVSPTRPGMTFTSSPLARLLGRTSIVKCIVRALVRRPSSDSDSELERQLALYSQNTARIQLNPSLPLAAPYWERSMGELQDLVRSVQDSGARCLVVCFPSWRQLHGRDDSSGPDGTSEPPATANPRLAQPQAVVREHVEQLGAPYLDLLPTYLAAEQWPYGGLDQSHPSAYGQRLAAEAIAAELTRLLATPLD